MSPMRSLREHGGAYMAACVPMDICFIDRSAYAAMPATGVDAVAMAAMKANAAEKVDGRE